MKRAIENSFKRGHSRIGMSFLSSAIKDLLEKKGVTQIELAKKSNLQSSHISRVVSGGQTFIKKEDLEKISTALTSSPVESAKLIRAHMLDECHGPGSHLIEVNISGERETQPAWFSDVSKLSPEAQNAIARLAKACAKNPELESFIISTANVTVGKE